VADSRTGLRPLAGSLAIGLWGFRSAFIFDAAPRGGAPGVIRFICARPQPPITIDRTGPAGGFAWPRIPDVKRILMVASIVFSSWGAFVVMEPYTFAMCCTARPACWAICSLVRARSYRGDHAPAPARRPVVSLRSISISVLVSAPLPRCTWRPAIWPSRSEPSSPGASLSASSYRLCRPPAEAHTGSAHGRVMACREQWTASPGWCDTVVGVLSAPSASALGCGRGADPGPGRRWGPVRRLRSSYEKSWSRPLRSPSERRPRRKSTRSSRDHRAEQADRHRPRSTAHRHCLRQRHGVAHFMATL